MNLVEALACRDFLEAHGVQVLMSRTKDKDVPLTEEIRECNAFNPDLAIDCHNNAGGGTSLMLAQNIEADVKAIGQNSLEF